MTDLVDRLFIAPIIGVICYFAHSALLKSMFLAFAPRTSGALFWGSLLASQFLAALIVACCAALPLVYFYRDKVRSAGFVASFSAAVTYAVSRIGVGSGSSLSILLSVLAIGLLLLLVPAVAVLALRLRSSIAEKMSANQRVDA